MIQLPLWDKETTLVREVRSENKEKGNKNTINSVMYNSAFIVIILLNM